MDYLLKSSALLAIFYSCYFLFLQRETFFQSNRWFLIAGLLTSIVLPFIFIPIYVEVNTFDLSSITPKAMSYVPFNNTVEITEEPFDVIQALSWVYFVGIVFFLIRLLLALFSLRKLFKATKLTTAGQFRIYETALNVTPFSFFNRIVYNPNQYSSEDLEHIINHEKVHARQWHSADILLVQLYCLLFWFNPVIWMYRKAMRQNLEFIADAEAQSLSFENGNYQKVLLKTSLSNQEFFLTNTFYTSLIKKRIVMLHQSKSKAIHKAKLVFAIPFIALFMMSFNTETIYVETNSNKVPNDALNLFQEDSVKITFHKDLTDADLKQIQQDLQSNNISFTYKRLKRNAQGEITAIKTVFTSQGNRTTYNLDSSNPISSFYFEQSQDEFGVGKVQNSEIETTKSLLANTQNKNTDDSDTTKVRKTSTSVVTVTSKAVNSKISDSLFTKTLKNLSGTISKDGTFTNINALENGQQQLNRLQVQDPLVILDGQESSLSVVQLFVPNQIESIHVLRGHQAIDAYGERAKHGALIVTTKNFLSIANSKVKDKIIVYRDADGQFKISGENIAEVLFILDGKKVSYSTLETVDKEDVVSVEVLDGVEAVQRFGSSGSNGAVIINTNSKNKKLVEVEENPWSVTSKVTAISYGSVNDTPTLEFIISKSSSEAFLEKQIKELAYKGLEGKFSRIKRNKKDEIIAIKISLTDAKGKTASAAWKNSDETIPDIVLEKSKDGKLFIRAIGD